jgi:hypothetical protein
VMPSPRRGMEVFMSQSWDAGGVIALGLGQLASDDFSA